MGAEKQINEKVSFHDLLSHSHKHSLPMNQLLSYFAHKTTLLCCSRVWVCKLGSFVAL